MGRELNPPSIPAPMTMTASAVIVVETRAPSEESLLRLVDLLAARFATVEIALIANDVPDEIAQDLARRAECVPDVTIHYLMYRVDFYAARLLGMDSALGDWVLLTSASPEELDYVDEMLSHAGGSTDLLV